MTLAHEGSRLALKNKVPALPEGMILFPLAGGVENTTADIPIISEQGLTFREDEKRFFGSVAIESSTTNLIPLHRQKFIGWSTHQGSIFTLTQNISVPEWGTHEATRIQTTGGTNNTKVHYTVVPAPQSGTYTLSCLVKNIGPNPLWVHGNVTGNMGTLQQGEARWLWTTGQGTERNLSNVQFLFRTLSDRISDSLDFIVFQPQGEELDHATSFTPTSRPVGNLSYDISHLGMRDAGCISCWIYNSDAMVNNRATNNQVNNQYLLKMGSDINDAHMDAMTLWIPNSIPRRFNFWTSSSMNTNHLGSLQDVSTYGVGSWNHFVIQWDKNGLPNGATKEFYINGVRQQSNNTTSLPSKTLTYFLLGQWSPNGSLIPSTLFEQLAIHPSKGFSAEEIRNWYNANAPFYDFRDTMLRW